MYRERPSELDGAVVWTHSSAPADVGRVLPDGCMDLLLWDGELVVAGPDTCAHLFARRPDSRMTGLRFPPGMGPSVFGVRAHELTDRRVPLDAVWPGREARLLAERIADAPEPGRAMEAVATGRLTEQMRGAPFAATLTGTVARMLTQGRAVAEVAATVGLSERQLHRRCRDAFGYGPKTLARVMRLREALRLAGDGLPLAGVAAAAGYADQAHLSREFKALAGVPVTELLPQGSRANRSIPLPSGSATTAYR